MKLEIRIGATRANSPYGASAAIPAQNIDVTHHGNRIRIEMPGKIIEGDAVEVATGTYSVLIGGHSYEVRVESAHSGLRVHAGAREFGAEIDDPRAWRRRRGGALEAEGRQEVVAPMPGKVVRVLAKQDDEVEAGQGLFVVEAMKMQNEIRSPKKGKLDRLLVIEGQVVNAGEPLAVVV
jgi:biotin carboxyl carrier protein